MLCQSCVKLKPIINLVTINYQIICIQKDATILIKVNWHQDPNFGTQKTKSAFFTLIFSITDLCPFILTLRKIYFQVRKQILSLINQKQEKCVANTMLSTR